MADTDTSPGLSATKSDVGSLCWFPFYPGDWLSSLDVRAMSATEKGYYIELLCHQWKECGFLRCDDDTLAKVCGTTLADDSWQRAISKFPRGPDGRANQRLLAIWDDQSRKHGNRVHSGKSRKNQNQNQNQIAPAMLQHCSSNAQAMLKQCSETEAKYTLSQCLSTANTIGVLPAVAESFFNHYAAVDFVDGAGRPITSLPHALKKWAANQESRGKTEPKKSRLATSLE